VRWAIFDTSVYVSHWQSGAHLDELRDLRSRLIVRHSSVVLSELRRGARTRRAQHLVESLRRLARDPWTPTAEDWWRSGGLIRKVGDDQGWDTRRRRDFQNDTLIALTARRHGSVVVTENRADFELLADELGIVVEVLG
jgi:predicted nucleic acid-binding protein